MKLRRFSQLGWHGCMDLVAAAAGHHVVRVELGEPPKMPFELCDKCTPHSLCAKCKVATWRAYDAHFGTNSEPRIRAAAATEDGTVFFKLPGASLTVTREWAEAMGLDPAKLEPDDATEPCEICKQLFPPRELDCEPYGRICDPCYWEIQA